MPAIIWLNYNGMHIIKVIELSLLSLSSFLKNYGKGLLIVVDNHSTDGSYERIYNFLNKLNVKYIMVRTRRNLGYSGGMNVGYKIALQEGAKLVVLANNDVIVFPGALTRLIKYLDKSDKLSGVQGILLRPGGSIDNIGYLIDELLITHPIKHIDRSPITPTYLSGALAAYKIDVLVECGFRKKLFFDAIPAYFDDVVLGLKLWNCGYSLASLPIKVGLHLHSATFSKYSRYRVFNALAAWRALEEVVSTRFKNILPLVRYKVLARFLTLYGLRKTFKVALEGIRLGKLYGELLRRRGLHLDLYRAPYVRVDYRRLARLLLTVKLGL